MVGYRLTSSPGARPLAALSSLVITAMLGFGCPPAKPPHPRGTITQAQLPKTVPALLVFAQKRIAPDATRGFHRLHHVDAVVALQKALGLAPKNQQVLLLGARISRALAERSRSDGEQMKYADLGLKFTAPGRTQYGHLVAFHYYHAALLGLRVEAYHASAFGGVPKIVAACRRAMAIDRSFDHAGPLRILGSLLSSVPATRPFNGDLERGLALLTEAVKLAPTFPLNHFFLAEALAKDDENDRATKHYQFVICAPLGRAWDTHMATKYRRLARRAAGKLGRKVTCPRTNAP